MERAVHPEPDPHRVRLWLDVQVGGALAHGLGEDALEDLDDRSVLVDHQGAGGLASVAAAAVPGWKVATTRSRPLSASYDRSMARSTSLAGASTKRRFFPAALRSSSTAAFASGPGTAITRRSSSARLTGSARWARTSDSGTRTTASESGETRRRSTSSRSSCSESALTSSPSLMIPCSTRISPRRRPELVCSSNACWIISLVIAPRDSSISPRRGPLCVTETAAPWSGALGCATVPSSSAMAGWPRRRRRPEVPT